MEVYTEQFIEWIETLSPVSIYFIFSVIAYLENIVPPIPGDLLVAFGGYLAAESLIGFTPILALTTIASVFGFMTMYYVGVYFGEKIEVQRRNFWLMRFIDVKYFDKAKRWMDKWGQGAILVNRFLAGTRSVISLTAGITKTKVNLTIINSSISSLLWNTILLGAGWLVHENWQIIGHYLNVYGWIILSVLIILVVSRIIYKVKKGRITISKNKFNNS